MRHTFLPLQDQQDLKRTYRQRAAIVALLMLSSALAICLIALFPSYVRVRSEQVMQQRLLDSAVSGISTSDDVRAELVRDMGRLDVLMTSSQVQPSLLIAEALAARGPVKLSAVSVEDVSSTTATVIVQGVAPTRDDLIIFKTRLETISGAPVDLPISGLAKNRDIPFSITYIAVSR